MIGFAIVKDSAPVPLADGDPVCDFAAYRAGFSPMPAWLALAPFLLALTRETRCRQMQ